MNSWRTVLITTGLAAIMLLSCSEDNSEPEALVNTMTAASKNYSSEVKYTLLKTDQLLEEMKIGQDQPGRYKVVHPCYTNAIRKKTIADSFFSYIDGLITGIEHAQHYPINEQEKKTMPHAVRTQLDLTYEKMMDGENDDRMFDAVLKKGRFRQDFTDTAGWEDHLFGKGVTKSIAVMNLWRIKAAVAAIEQFHVEWYNRLALHMCSMRFDYYDAVAFPRSAYLFPGEQSDANILFVNKTGLKYNDKRIKAMMVDGHKIPVANSLHSYSYTENVPGKHTHYGKLMLEDDSNLYRGRDVKWENFVFTPAAHVTYDEPIALTAGKAEAIVITHEYVPSKDIIVSLSRGSISGSNGHYKIKVDDTGQVKLAVAYRQNGTVYKIDSFYYDVR